MRRWFVALVTVALVGLAPAPVLAQPALDTHTIHFVRLNCDDEAERFSDEVEFYVGGRLVGLWSNLDGGDWRDIPLRVTFEQPVYVELREQDNWRIGDTWIDAGQAGQGEIVVHWNGHHGTAYAYRLTYWVE